MLVPFSRSSLRQDSAPLAMLAPKAGSHHEDNPTCRCLISSAARFIAAEMPHRRKARPRALVRSTNIAEF